MPIIIPNEVVISALVNAIAVAGLQISKAGSVDEIAAVLHRATQPAPDVSLSPATAGRSRFAAGTAPAVAGSRQRHDPHGTAAF
jgi:hypothetical protein